MWDKWRIDTLDGLERFPSVQPKQRYRSGGQRVDAADNFTGSATVAQSADSPAQSFLEIIQMMRSAPDAKRHCVLRADLVSRAESVQMPSH